MVRLLALMSKSIARGGIMIKVIKRFWERGRKGYCYEDIWSFENWLSKTIANGLREFRDNCYTYPNDIDDWDKWMSILDEMIECFEEQGRNIDENMSGDFMERWRVREEYQKQKLHRGLELLERYWWDLWN